MNRTKIKNYAPQARRDFLQAVKDRAAFYGLTADRIEPVTAQGDVAIIGGRAFPRAVADKRKALQERVERDGYGPTMEALAYTWFNRLVAIRYMELKGYLEHGFRVLSNPDPARTTPEVLDRAEHVELPDLNRGRVIELKLDGSKEAELYRMLLVAQCNALHSAMPFLFERIGDETELVLPESLLHSDSILRKLVSGIDEEDWKEVEIIGWLYEAYVSERYEAVIGSVVASADIPAATQRFTPKWIVRYLVQNTLGRLWLATYPQSPLKGQMKYYIEPAEQTPEVQEQLRAITPTSLNPEEITFLDPACGSAHILVEAYDLFKAIYQERGYRARDIPRLILGKNLFGLEIDDRAAQLAAFALMMKARADDRRIFEPGVQPQVRALVQTDDMDAEDVAAFLNLRGPKETPPPGSLFETEDNLFTRAALTATTSPVVSLTEVKALVDLFEDAKTFGSLIQVPPALVALLPQIEQRCREIAGQTGEIASRTAAKVLPVVEQAQMLAGRYDCVVANPPYMNSSGMTNILKCYVAECYPDEKADLFAAFICRCFYFSKSDRYVALIAMQSWMFLKTYQNMRSQLLSNKAIISLAHLGPRAFSSISGEVVSVAAFCCLNARIAEIKPIFLRLVEGDEQGKEASFHGADHRYSGLAQSAFGAIPGSPISYWASDSVRRLFSQSKSLAELAAPKQGMATTKDELFIRYWHEVSCNSIGFGMSSEEESSRSGKRWFPLNKGGGFRKWFGNNDLVVNYKDKGKEVCDYIDNTPGARVRSNGRVINRKYYFHPGITWGLIAGHTPSFRYFDQGFIISHKGCGIFVDDPIRRTLLLGYLNSRVASHMIEVISPSQGCEVGHINIMPVPLLPADAKEIIDRLVVLHESDWNAAETSWGFQELPLLDDLSDTIQHAITEISTRRLTDRATAKHLEESNNRIFIEASGLLNEVSADIPDDQITLDFPDVDEDTKRLISYTVGCTMGRYSLDTPGLVYAHGSNVGFDPAQYRTFPADPDGIVPVMEADWFADDAANRLVEFLGVAWPREGLDENLKFVADALGPSRGEQPRDTIRRYLATGFYKHHLQTYKRRPIYWLFSSGKQRAFQCLVYLHRYHDGTLARMRTEYVIPLQGKLGARIDQLAGDILKKDLSTSHRTTLTKERDKLIKQQAELQAYDEKLRHFADMRIALDLDDGVKVNYGKFGDLLAEVKAVTGGRDED